MQVDVALMAARETAEIAIVVGAYLATYPARRHLVAAGVVAGVATSAVLYWARARSGVVIPADLVSGLTTVFGLYLLTKYSVRILTSNRTTERTAHASALAIFGAIGFATIREATELMVMVLAARGDDYRLVEVLAGIGLGAAIPTLSMKVVKFFRTHSQLLVGAYLFLHGLRLV